MINILTVAVVACWVGGTVAQEIHLGRCPKVTTVQNFDVSRVRYTFIVKLDKLYHIIARMCHPFFFFFYAKTVESY